MKYGNLTFDQLTDLIDIEYPQLGIILYDRRINQIGFFDSFCIPTKYDSFVDKIYDYIRRGIPHVVCIENMIMHDTYESYLYKDGYYRFNSSCELLTVIKNNMPLVEMTDDQFKLFQLMEVLT